MAGSQQQHSHSHSGEQRGAQGACRLRQRALTQCRGAAAGGAAPGAAAAPAPCRAWAGRAPCSAPAEVGQSDEVCGAGCFSPRQPAARRQPHHLQAATHLQPRQRRVRQQRHLLAQVACQVRSHCRLQRRPPPAAAAQPRALRHALQLAGGQRRGKAGRQRRQHQCIALAPVAGLPVRSREGGGEGAVSVRSGRQRGSGGPLEQS